MGVFTSEVLELERHEQTATLWLARPEARNAMGKAFFSDLGTAMRALADDRDVRAVVVAGKGPHFSVGLDLKAMGDLLVPGGQEDTTDSGDGGGSMAARAASVRASVRRLQASITVVADFPKPVIAAVHGYCIGGGIDLISACDIRLASNDAVFSVRETKMAIVADLGSLQRLPGIIGSGQVAELVYTGKDVDAARAKEIGLVNDAFADREALMAAAQELAGAIAANSPLAVQGTKAVLAAGKGRSVAEALDYVALWNAGMLASNDLTEAVSAFFERRDPKFTGR